jgi:hypothetical protein
MRRGLILRIMQLAHIANMKRARAGILVTTLLLIISWTVPVYATEASLSDIVVSNTRDHLLVYFTVQNCFTQEMNEAIDSGLNTTFTFYVKLYERRNILWDKEIADIKISHSIKFDSLKGVYEVRFSEENNKVVTVRNFDEAKKLMAQVATLKVMPLNELKKGSRYQLQMMAELDKIQLPFYLHYVLFFLSLWDFKTDWYAVDFRY